VIEPSGAVGHAYYEQAAPMFEVGSSTAPAQTHLEVEPAADYAGFCQGQWEPHTIDLAAFDSMGYFPQPQQVSHTRTSIISTTLTTFIGMCRECHTRTARDFRCRISRFRNGHPDPAASGARRKDHFTVGSGWSTILPPICAIWRIRAGNTCRFLQFPKLP
jgi:hypothetical protein